MIWVRELAVVSAAVLGLRSGLPSNLVARVLLFHACVLRLRVLRDHKLHALVNQMDCLNSFCLEVCQATQSSLRRKVYTGKRAR